MARKPKISISSIPIIEDINREVLRYNIRGPIDNWCHVAADVLDGAVFKSEVADLIRRRYLLVMRYDEWGNPNSMLCGSNWSVDLTDMAVRTFWPDRYIEAAEAA